MGYMNYDEREQLMIEIPRLITALTVELIQSESLEDCNQRIDNYFDGYHFFETIRKEEAEAIAKEVKDLIKVALKIQKERKFLKEFKCPYNKSEFRAAECYNCKFCFNDGIKYTSECLYEEED